MNHTPVRHLYRVLCEIETEESLLENLADAPGFADLVGDPEPRFCEWAYTKIHEMTFCRKLSRHALHRSELNKLARILNDKPIPDGIKPRFWLAELLRKHFLINEPCVPEKVYNGLQVIRDFCAWAKAQLDGDRAVISVEESLFTSDPVATCRKATERLLKTITLFLLNTECKEMIERVWTGGVFGFETPSDCKSTSITKYIESKSSIGIMNHLLLACSLQYEEEQSHLPFLRSNTPLWSDHVFRTFVELAQALNDGLHDKGKKGEQLLETQISSVQSLLLLDKTFDLHLPRVIQFFRRYDDGNGVYHYDGKRDDSDLVHFYESKSYELHHPYLYLSSTNPSSVDAVCTEVMPFLYNPI